MQKRFNELGAMLLSELVQQLSDALSEHSSSVRQVCGIASGMARGVARIMARGVARGMPRGVARGMPRGVARGMPRGVARGMPRGMARGMPRGILHPPTTAAYPATAPH